MNRTDGDAGAGEVRTGDRRVVPASSVLVCSSPRSGERLLASGLRSAGAGAPEPRLWCGWRGHDEMTSGLLRQDPAAPEVARAYERVRSIGTAADGRFCANVRWPELDRLLTALHAHPDTADLDDDDLAAPELALLRGFLPGVQFVHLVREDKAAQALAWWRARHPRDSTGRPARAGRGRPGSASIDPFGVEQLEQHLRDEEWRWVSFFTRAGVAPLVVSYEALTEDNAATIARVLDYLELPTAPAPAAGPATRQPTVADAAQRDYRRWRRRRAAGTAHDADAPVSIVVTGHGTEDDLGATVASVRAGIPVDSEVVVVVESRPASQEDGGGTSDVGGALVVRPPTPAGPAAARNLGARHATGDTLVFLDARARPREGWLEPLREALAETSVAVVGPAVVDPSGTAPPSFGLTWRDPLLRARRLEERPRAPVPVPFVAACCMAFRRSDFDAVGGFDAGMLGGGVEDAEICLHLWRRGRLCMVAPGAEVADGRPAAGTAPPGAAARDLLHDSLRLATTHFGPDTLLRTFDTALGSDTFREVYTRLVTSDVFERRRRVVATSIYDESHFIDRFGMDALMSRAERGGAARPAAEQQEGRA